MAMLDPKEKSFRFKRIAIIAFCLLVLDAFIIGLPVFGAGISALLILASGVSAILFLFRNKHFSKLYALKALIYFTTLIGIIGIFKLNAYLGERNAYLVINAVNSYHADAGNYPENLNQLIPKYLKSIPKSSYRISDNRFRYRLDSDNAYLTWTVAPPFGRRDYNFNKAEWIYLD